jgi:hypothetical protein
MTQTYNVNVNGQSHQVEAEADTPLLHVIRTHLRLTGSRFGCGARRRWLGWGWRPSPTTGEPARVRSSAPWPSN